MDSSGGDDDDQQQQQQQQQSPQPLSSGGGGEGNIMMMNEGTPTPTPIPIIAPPPPPKAETPNFIGKHRMAAALAHLQHQIQIIQEELEELETCGESSLVCKELVSTVESLPDALLSVTKGPAVVGWDRWFHGAHGSRGRKRWI